MFLAGSFLIWEHIYTWSEFAFFDFIGHEWLGLILILVGIGININFSRVRLSGEIKWVIQKLGFKDDKD